MKTVPRKEYVNKRLHVYYSGMVQGVGFRFTAERLAASLRLRGWVMNMDDGRVEVMCEGKTGDLKTFLQKIDDIFRKYIRSSDIEWSEAGNEFIGFDIRY